MKKLFLSLVAAIMATSTVFAQGSLLATLSHDGTISAFYGATALKAAVEAAKNGDVITLSSGQFNAVNIDKLITLRGAGMSVNTDSVNAHEASIIQGEFTITQADTLEGRIIMEGLYFSERVRYAGILKNAQFLKCRFYKFVGSSNPVMVNSSFINCRFNDVFYLHANSNAYFVNSIICNPVSRESSSSIEFDNCFIKYDGHYSDAGRADYVVNSYYKNCVIQGISSCQIPSSCTAYYCVGIGYSGLFEVIKSKNTTNRVVSLKNLFKTYNNVNYFINDYDSFELTDEAAATYHGTDGTQVGVYGGNLPYDENPTIPQITKCNVASKSTADGKLSVDIEVRAAEY